MEIIIETYKKLRYNKRWAHIKILIGLSIIIMGVFMGFRSITVIVFGVYVFLNILALKTIDIKIKLRDKLREEYERHIGKELTESEFDGLFTKSNSDSSSKSD